MCGRFKKIYQVEDALMTLQGYIDHTYPELSHIKIKFDYLSAKLLNKLKYPKEAESIIKSMSTNKGR